MAKKQRTDVAKLLKAKQGVRLDLGCGANKQDGGFLGIDKRPTPAVDLVHDLEVFPWPLPDNCASCVVMSHFWEHIKPWLTLPFMAEVHRVCKPGAQVFVSAPYAMGYRYMQDPTHCNPSVEATWCYWDDRHQLYEVYKPAGVFHLLSYDVVPAGGDKDFNAVLQVVKA
jgi:predicted SAM-dependent methyltransferase